MIPTMNSQELNKIFKQAQDKSISVTEGLNNAKKDIAKKLTILNYQTEFIKNKLNTIKGEIWQDDIVAFNHTSTGDFSDYGSCVHAKFNKTPIDLFNLKLNNGGSMFRDDIFVRIDGIEREEYKSILMAENTLNKEIYFEEYFTNTVNIEVEIDRSNILGTTRFNVIEIDPYIYGAYDILSINIYTSDETGATKNEPTFSINGFDSIGRTRIILDKKYKLHKISMDFKINLKSYKADQEVYPFGLKHIYFYEADFKPTSFVVAEYINDEYIEYINDKTMLYTTQGKIDTTLSEYNIEVYTDYVGNTLSGRVYPSTETDKNRIIKNTKRLYLKIPLVLDNFFDSSTKQYLTLNGIKVNAHTFTEKMI